MSSLNDEPFTVKSEKESLPGCYHFVVRKGRDGPIINYKDIIKCQLFTSSITIDCKGFMNDIPFDTKSTYSI